MKNELIKRCITGAVLGLGFWYLFFYFQPFVLSLVLALILILILATEMPKLYNYKNPIFWLATVAYPIIPFAMLIELNQQHSSRKLVLLICALSIANDIGAFFIGKIWGKHKLMPSLSPKKTIEGFMGGWAAVFTTLMFLLNASFMHTLLASFIAATVATAGDLFESWLKRKARIKDSGTLLPGHGGLLDRFDSILAVTILVYMFRAFIRF